MSSQFSQDLTQVVNKVYRKHARDHHPDRNPSASTQSFNRLTEEKDRILHAITNPSGATVPVHHHSLSNHQQFPVYNTRIPKDAFRIPSFLFIKRCFYVCILFFLLMCVYRMFDQTQVLPDCYIPSHNMYSHSKCGDYVKPIEVLVDRRKVVVYVKSHGYTQFMDSTTLVPFVRKSLDDTKYNRYYVLAFVWALNRGAK
ncbi:hypothetical protein GEMRC1_001871 [Eukaryota sp. GEM-RC1]